MNRMNSGSIISMPAAISARRKTAADRESMRPEPSEVRAKILAPLTLPLALLSRRVPGTDAVVGRFRLVGSFGDRVEAAMLVVLNERLVALAG